jgi:hypothetical protein
MELVIVLMALTIAEFAVLTALTTQPSHAARLGADALLTNRAISGAARCVRNFMIGSFVSRRDSAVVQQPAGEQVPHALAARRRRRLQRDLGLVHGLGEDGR